MKKILFVCSAGMSTSLLVTKTQQAAKERNVDVEVFAMSEAEAKSHVGSCAAILLGPQVRFLLPGIKKMVEGLNIKVDVINTIHYGRLDGNAVLDQILGMIQ